jgi:uncharacterized protein
MNRPAHFEIQAQDPERAIKFYKDVFGWDFQKWEGSPTDYWMIMTAPKDSKEAGINGGLLKSPAAQPPEGCGTNAYVVTMLVEDFDGIAKKIEEAGGKVAMPKFALAGMAWQGYYLDPEGNTFGIHQSDPNAK